MAVAVVVNQAVEEEEIIIPVDRITENKMKKTKRNVAVAAKDHPMEVEAVAATPTEMVMTKATRMTKSMTLLQIRPSSKP